MANEYFQPGSIPAPNSPGSSAVMRQEFASISQGFDKLPILAGHAGEIVAVNPTGTALVTSGAVVGDYVTKDGVFTLTNKTIAWADNTFPGFGDAATRNAGKNAGQVLLLENNMQLPAIDGSLLTGLNSGMISGVVQISQGGTGGTTLFEAQTALGIDLKADAFNAVLTGAPTAPTPPTGDNSARIATTYFVTETLAAIGSFSPSNATPLMDGVASSGVGTLGSRDDHVHPTDTSRAPLVSPALTGTPTAPTAAVQTDTTQIATTAFVNAEINADRPYSNANPVMDGVASQGVSPRISRQDHVHPTDTSRAPIASPTFTGVPAAPTPATSTNTTQLATTAFVQSLIAQQPPGVQVSNSTPVMNGAAAPGLGVEASRWDHVHPTDTSRVSKAGDTMTGTLNVNGVVSASGGGPGAGGYSTLTLNEGSKYVGLYHYKAGLVADKWIVRGNMDASWNLINVAFDVDPQSAVAQGTAVGSLTRKDYVDGQVSTLNTTISGKVSKAGDTMTGNLTVPVVLASAGQDTSINALTRKDYVDGQVATRLPLTGGTLTGGLEINPAYAAGTSYGLSVQQDAVGNLSGIYFSNGDGGFILRGSGGSSDVRANLYDGGNSCYNLLMKAAATPQNFQLKASISGTTNDFCIVSGDGTYSYRLQPAGAGWTTLSTRDSKENIRPVESSLDKINALEPVRFNYKVSPTVDSIGFIAEDICQVDPILASYDIDGTPTGVGKDNIVPFLVKAVQELSAKLDSAMAEIAELKAAK